MFIFTIILSAESMENNHAGTDCEDTTPLTGLTKVTSRSNSSRTMKLASLFFFMAFAFHTISTVTFSLGADIDTNSHAFYHHARFAAPLIGLLITAYILGLFAFIIIVLLLKEDLCQLNQEAMETMKAVTLGCIFLQC